MKTTIQVAVIAGLVGLGSHSMAAQEELLRPRNDESLLGTYLLNETVQGVSLSTRATAFLSIVPEGSELRIKARSVVDLSDLQQKAGSLVDTIPLPDDNCASFSLDNIVVRVWDKQITVSGSEATLRLKGDVDIWTCLENPIPCSKIEWDGIVPRVVAYACNPPIMNRILNQPFEAAIPFWLARLDPQTVAIELGPPNVQLGGSMGDLTSRVLVALGVDLNRQVKEALNRAINPDLLKASLPEQLRQLNPSITRAELLSNGGSLAATLEMSVLVDAESLSELFRLLQNGRPGGR